MMTTSDAMAADAMQQMRGIGQGTIRFQAVYTASRLGVADCLADGPKRADEVAAAVGAHAPSLYRLLRGLTVFGVFAEDDCGRFALTPASQLLRSDAPESLRHWFALQGAEWYLRMLGQLEHAVRTGQSGAVSAFGMPLFAFLAADSEAGAVFDRAMTSQHHSVNPAVLAAYDFSRFGTVVDVGGGHGHLLRTILTANPSVRGILYDQPSVIEGARHDFEIAGLADRCDLVAGDFFQDVPAGGDLYILMNILHDWDDAAAAVILGHIRGGMGADGRLIVLEQVIPAGTGPHPGKTRDLAMLLVGGKERTEAEFRAVLAEAGFALDCVEPIGTVFNLSLLAARPV